MFSSLHRASFTTGEKPNQVTHHVTKALELPFTLEDLAELTNNRLSHDGVTPFTTEDIEITVGYKITNLPAEVPQEDWKTYAAEHKDWKPEWERVYKTVPFWIGMAIEGYKLLVNGQIRPKQADAGVEQSDVEAYAATLGEMDGLIAKTTWAIGNAKAKKALKDKVLAWKAEA